MAKRRTQFLVESIPLVDGIKKNFNDSRQREVSLLKYNVPQDNLIDYILFNGIFDNRVNVRILRNCCFAFSSRDTARKKQQSRSFVHVQLISIGGNLSV